MTGPYNHTVGSIVLYLRTRATVAMSHPMIGKTKLSVAPPALTGRLLLFLAVLAPPMTCAEIVFSPPESPGADHHIPASARSVCDGTLYQHLCVSTLSAVLQNLPSASLPDLIAATVNTTIVDVLNSRSKCSDILRRTGDRLGPLPSLALSDCLELLDRTVSRLKAAAGDLSGRSVTSGRTLHDLETLLSTAITNQYTCLDGFAHGGGRQREIIREGLLRITRHASNSLAMLKKLRAAGGVAVEADPGYPGWITRRDRRLLEAAAGTKFDVVVAKDGSGNFTTVGGAVAAAPSSGASRFVIYIKAGAYMENVEVGSAQTRVMFVGDGIGKTVIKASRSAGTNWTTFRSATVAVVGDGFLATGITIENAAGPSNFQAVALRSGSDLSAFYRCSFVGYQDTLYAHSMRQFYRDCDVYGTVDFVFGDAAALLQGCNLYARRPAPRQKNVFTAQGREDPNQSTGLSLVGCKIAAAEDLLPVVSSVKSYLGRPWKAYSRTVVMVSQIEGLIDPAGWVEWSGDFGLRTLYYGEYGNRGGGANTSGRVTWPGYRVINSSTEAMMFTAGSFVQGGDWLPATGFPFYLGLT